MQMHENVMKICNSDFHSNRAMQSSCCNLMLKLFINAKSFHFSSPFFSHSVFGCCCCRFKRQRPFWQTSKNPIERNFCSFNEVIRASKSWKIFISRISKEILIPQNLKKKFLILFFSTKRGARISEAIWDALNCFVSNSRHLISTFLPSTWRRSISWSPKDYPSYVQVGRMETLSSSSRNSIHFKS